MVCVFVFRSRRMLRPLDFQSHPVFTNLPAESESSVPSNVNIQCKPCRGKKRKEQQLNHKIGTCSKRLRPRPSPLDALDADDASPASTSQAASPVCGLDDDWCHQHEHDNHTTATSATSAASSVKCSERSVLAAATSTDLKSSFCASDVVCLNVGGRTFMTTVATLTIEQNSMLARMFSGRYKLSKVDGGGFTTTGHERTTGDRKQCCSTCSSTADNTSVQNIFFDRSPQVFELILDYLRNGPDFVVPRDHQTRHKLAVEAKYFGIDRLVEILEAPVVKHFKHRFDGDSNGIIYHLGTLRSDQWTNPHVTGLLGITASEGMCENLDDLSTDEEGEVEGPIGQLNYPMALYCARASQQFPKKPFRFIELSSCDAFETRGGAWVMFDFGTRRVRMCAYTLRYGDCYGTGGCWEWEASNDQKTWTSVHSVKGDPHLNCDNPKFPRKFRVETTAETVTSKKRLKAIKRRSMLCSHTFKIKDPNPEYFRFFRIKKSNEPAVKMSMAKGHDKCCLHVWGLEIYGSMMSEDEQRRQQLSL
eukprot:CAMPEP_0197522560 /NCGR_PEP_ID=MMETSP1318-20131121/7683_1 /TAXON_ID=552666 /ORGANISM="Partenskyella glossopodia, Strain RCC365" /LENGTH=532 /DNA_ID=CAMNT_0043074975 /DNA_START=73 /DNA_END=1671 /DNA_ORIENTATION=-